MIVDRIITLHGIEKESIEDNIKHAQKMLFERLKEGTVFGDPILYDSIKTPKDIEILGIDKYKFIGIKGNELVVWCRVPSFDPNALGYYYDFLGEAKENLVMEVDDKDFFYKLHNFSSFVKFFKRQSLSILKNLEKDYYGLEFHIKPYLVPQIKTSNKIMDKEYIQITINYKDNSLDDFFIKRLNKDELTAYSKKYPDKKFIALRNPDFKRDLRKFILESLDSKLSLRERITLRKNKWNSISEHCFEKVIEENFSKIDDYTGSTKWLGRVKPKPTEAGEYIIKHFIGEIGINNKDYTDGITNKITILPIPEKAKKYKDSLEEFTRAQKFIKKIYQLKRALNQIIKAELTLLKNGKSNLYRFDHDLNKLKETLIKKPDDLTDEIKEVFGRYNYQLSA